MSDITKAYGRDLDLNLLRVFAVVAEEGSITRAASRLYVSQPAISASMRRLTAFVGADLFTRQGRGIALTSRGAQLERAARLHLAPLVSATAFGEGFDPATSTATVRIGLADGLEPVILPSLYARLARAAPNVRLAVSSVNFRSVETALTSGRADLALCVADEQPRSIVRRTLFPGSRAGGHVCIYDPTEVKLPRPLTARAYFEQEHIVVSYAGDFRGVIEDVLGRARKVRLSVSTFNYVADIVSGSALLATVPMAHAQHMRTTHPHLRIQPLPFALEPVPLDLLSLRVNEDDPLQAFVRERITDVVRALDAKLRRH